MRVAFLITTVHDIGGTAGAVVTQANALADHHDVTVVSVLPPADRQHHFPLDPRVEVRDLVDGSLDALRGREPLLLPWNADPGLDARADAALEAALPALEADVVVTVTPAMLSYAVQLAPARTAVVHQEHRSSHSRPNSRDLLLDHARRADVVAMLTEPMAHWLRRQLGAAAPEIVVVPNALAPGFRPRSPLTEPVILAAGRLATEKQWPTLISAFGRVADRIPEWRIRIFGEGQARFDAMGAVRKLGLWDRVELPGPTSDMAGEWARASLSALTSQAGAGFPLVIQEAMAAGVPVVAYDMPTGPRDEIDHGVDGLLVDQGSEAGLAAALLRLATDDDERRRMGAAARAKAAAWDSATITARWLEVLERAVARHGAGPGIGPGRSSAVAAARGGATPPDPDVAPHGCEGVGVTPEQARRELLGSASVLAASVSEEWWVVPPQRDLPATVVLPMAARAAFVAGLAGDDVLPDYASVHDPEHRGWPSRRGTPAEMVAPLLRAHTGRLLLEPWPRVAAGDDVRGALLGRGCAVAVEFWEPGPDGDLHAPGRATWTTSAPPTTPVTATFVEGVKVPVPTAMAGPTVYDVRFPVDVVYTWVDGADPAWEAARAARLGGAADPTMLTRASSGRARYVDRGELRWSLRSLHLFAPWVRRIHLVTAGQVPDWLDADHPSINLVDHADLLPPEALPTFNSHAIETALHRIEGLAEHFVYLNDDFFVGAPVRPEAFFTPAGSTAVALSSTVVGLPGQEELPWARAAGNNRRLLQRAFGVTTVNTLVHAPYAHRVSVLTEIAERFAPEVAATASSPFRSSTDVSMLSSLAQHYGLATGTAHVVDADYAYVDITEAIVRRRLRDLLGRERAGFCLGDSHEFARDPEHVAAMVASFLDDYFPIAAPWER